MEHNAEHAERRIAKHPEPPAYFINFLYLVLSKTDIVYNLNDVINQIGVV